LERRKVGALRTSSAKSLPSMGPPPGSGGKIHDDRRRRDEPSSASMGPPLGSGGKASMRTELEARRECFNGAAAWERRKACFRHPGSSRQGVASMGPPLGSGGKKDGMNMPTWTQTLQWGRRLGAAERRRRSRLPPDRLSCFNGAAAWERRKARWFLSELELFHGFNGAAAWERRKGTLPFGHSVFLSRRFNGAAAWERRKERGVGRLGQSLDASMGPPLGSGGKAQQATQQGNLTAASMGPPLGSGGKQSRASPG